MERARGWLVLLSVACPIISILAVLLTTSDFSGSASNRWYALVIAIIVGTFIGLGQAPFVARALVRKRLAVFVPLIYITASAGAFAVMLQGEPLWSIVTFAVSVPLLAIMASLLPNRKSLAGQRCYACGYDLSGGHDGICSECGAPQVAAPPEPPTAMTA